MKFTVAKRNLLPALKKVGKIARNNHPDILNCVLIEAGDRKIDLIVTDLEVSSKLSVRAYVEEKGEAVVEAKKLLNLIKGALDKVIFSTEEDVLVITSKKEGTTLTTTNAIQFKMEFYSPEEYPQLDFIPKAESGVSELESGFLKDVVRKTAYATSKEEGETLSGVLWTNGEGKFQAVGTDGTRMSVVEREEELKSLGKEGVIIPARALVMLKDFLTEGKISFAVDDEKVYFWNHEGTFTARSIDGGYPDYNAVLGWVKDYEHIVTLGRRALLEVLKRVSGVLKSGKRTVPVKLIFKRDKLVVAGGDSELGEYEEEIAVSTGIEASIKLNSKYLIEALTSMDANEVVWKFKDGEHAVMLEPKGENYKAIIMPIL